MEPTQDQLDEAAHIDWLRRYTWVQPDGSLDYHRPRLRPECQRVDWRELRGVYMDQEAIVAIRAPGA